MCGIAGIVAADSNAKVDAAQVREMCAAIVHRGPDDEGVYCQDLSAWVCAALALLMLLVGSSQSITKIKAYGLFSTVKFIISRIAAGTAGAGTHFLYPLRHRSHSPSI